MVAEPKCAFHLKRPKPFDALAPGCQFDVNDADLIEWDNKHWCEFHLPLKATDEAGYPIRRGKGDERARLLVDLFDYIKARNGKSPVDLSGVQVPNDADFREFDKEHPLERACLAAAAFGDGCKFNRVMFGKQCGFDGMTFGEACKFDDVTFGEACSFDGTTFGKSCSFERSKFGQSCRFKGATFGHQCRFDGARFGDRSRFDGATFGRRCKFVGATFGTYCRFVGATFGEWCSFAAAPATKENVAIDPFAAIFFADSEFKGEANFEGRQFTSTADFTDVVFGGVPLFHGCTFHSDVRFRGAAFRDTHSASAPAAYRVLKQAMEGLRAHDEQAMFFALQQRSQRHQLARTDPVRWLSKLYDLTSEYGGNFTRPLRWIGGLVASVWLVGAMYRHATGDGRTILPSVENVGEAFVATLTQTVRPFEYLRTGGDLNGWFAFGWSLYSIAVLALVALFLLALRRSFKLD